MPPNRNSILVTLRLQSSVDDVAKGNFWKSLIAESFGTFILVFIGLGSCYGSAGVVGASLAFGLGGAIGIWTIAPISGGNINPAVSLGLLIARKMSFFRCMLYMLFQFIGAVVASKLMMILTMDSFPIVQGISTRNVSPEKAFLCEIVITFVLVFTVMRMCVEKSRSDTERGVAALAIGISITVGILCAASISGGSMNPARSLGPVVAQLDFVDMWANISGGSMNPARSLGPAAASADFTDIWIYVAGPLIGGALAGFLQQVLFTSDLSMEHICSYLTNPNFGKEVTYVKHEEDLESNCCSEKNSLKMIPKTNVKSTPKNTPKKSGEKLELLEENTLEDILEVAN